MRAGPPSPKAAALLMPPVARKPAPPVFKAPVRIALSQSDGEKAARQAKREARRLRREANKEAARLRDERRAKRPGMSIFSAMKPTAAEAEAAALAAGAMSPVSGSGTGASKMNAAEAEAEAEAEGGRDNVEEGRSGALAASKRDGEKDADTQSLQASLPATKAAVNDSLASLEGEVQAGLSKSD